jgi:hypothetical protein
LKIKWDVWATWKGCMFSISKELIGCIFAISQLGGRFDKLYNA